VSRYILCPIIHAVEIFDVARNPLAAAWRFNPLTDGWQNATSNANKYRLAALWCGIYRLPHGPAFLLIGVQRVDCSLDAKHDAFLHFPVRVALRIKR
jgi:hypothetical protein